MTSRWAKGEAPLGAGQVVGAGGVVAGAAGQAGQVVGGGGVAMAGSRWP